MTYEKTIGTDLFGNPVTIKQTRAKITDNRPIENYDFEPPAQAVQMVSIRPNSMVLYRDDPNFKRSRNQPFFFIDDDGEIKKLEKPPRPKNFTDGFLSDKAGCRLRNAIKILFWLSGVIKLHHGKFQMLPQGKITFLTLTLSYIQQHEDTYIKKNMLNQFITEITFKYPGLIYIWRAEKQENGNIHFHFLLNKFIPWQVCRSIWNRIQLKEGYIAAYQEKFQNLDFWNYCRLNNYNNPAKLNIYKRGYNYGVATNWTDPNSIDITNLKSKKNAYAYISKYASKRQKDPDTDHPENTDHLKIEGRLYYCSQQISKIKPAKEIVTYSIQCELRHLLKTVPEKFIEADFFTLIAIPAEQLFEYGCFTLFKLFTDSILPIGITFTNTT